MRTQVLLFGILTIVLVINSELESRVHLLAKLELLTRLYGWAVCTALRVRLLKLDRWMVSSNTCYQLLEVAG